MPNFTGQLNVNEVFAPIYNMILAQQIFADNIYETKSTLVDMSRVDGGLFGDTKLYYSTDVLKSYEWRGDEEAQDLLKLHRPQAPECQAVTIDKFRIIPLTVDNYLTKRAWSTEGAFSSFNNQMIGWMRETKRIYDATMFNSYIGTTTTNEGKQIVQIKLPAEPEDATEVNLEAYNRIKAQTIATEFADLLVDVEDITRDYNDYGNLRSLNPDNLVYVWNASQVNQIRKLDLPSLFHKDGLIDKFAQHTLPPRYFGTVNTSAGTTDGANSTIRSLIEKDYNTVEPNQVGYDEKKHIFPGDLLPPNTKYGENETYSEDPTIVCKIYHKRSVPLMSAFQTGSEFWNPRSLTRTMFLIWGYNHLEYLKNYPFITVKTTVKP